MRRFCFYIDGFNMYYALKKYPQFKWLNYRKLAEAVIGGKDSIEKIYYFSAYVTWLPDNFKRHKNYIKALRWADVEFIPGRFKKKHIQCHQCNKIFQTHEEKQTDVNIAITILRDAFQNIFDTAVIISADSDLLPAVAMVHSTFPEKEIGIMFPIGSNSFELRQHADFCPKMPQKLLRKCQFPDTIKIGKMGIHRPANWK